MKNKSRETKQWFLSEIRGWKTSVQAAWRWVQDNVLLFSIFFSLFWVIPLVLMPNFILNPSYYKRIDSADLKARFSGSQDPRFRCDLVITIDGIGSVNTNTGLINRDFRHNALPPGTFCSEYRDRKIEKIHHMKGFALIQVWSGKQNGIMIPEKIVLTFSGHKQSNTFYSSAYNTIEAIIFYFLLANTFPAIFYGGYVMILRILIKNKISKRSVGETW